MDINDKILRTFPNSKNELIRIIFGKNEMLYLNDKNYYIDLTGGGTSFNTVGYSNRRIINKMVNKALLISHADFKTTLDEDREKLAELLLKDNKISNEFVYFAGNSGGEGIEAAMKLSYQTHLELGYSKRNIFISRMESYHGSSTDAIAISDRKNLLIYKDLFPCNRYKISDHYFIKNRRIGETKEEYTKRCLDEFEKKILELGPEKVCAFIGETIMGGLQGFIEPCDGYWKGIRDICDKYGIHLILDEVICGCGVTGNYYCIEYDGITPDFLVISKGLTSGYFPLNAVLLTRKTYEAISNGSGRTNHSTTFQGHSIGCAVALEVTKIVKRHIFLKRVQKLGDLVRQKIESYLKGHPNFIAVHGRGLRISIEYSFNNMISFADYFRNLMKQKYKILLDVKWHRILLSPPLTISEDKLLSSVEKICLEFLNYKE
ncbi:MAG: aminotransferase class III-fold pyridoxal phosphate-dependent enzyme [Chthoniobacterales bacterium]|nr:aminotransferase class III-fold pyridoxal phosphate-dependent enzyme [Chthoniobacterales bacterium]